MVTWIHGYKYRTEIPKDISRAPLNSHQTGLLLFWTGFGRCKLPWNSLCHSSDSLVITVVKGRYFHFLTLFLDVRNEIFLFYRDYWLFIFFLYLIRMLGFFLTMCLFWIFISLHYLANILYIGKGIITSISVSALLFLDSFCCWVDLTYS